MTPENYQHPPGIKHLFAQTSNLKSEILDIDPETCLKPRNITFITMKLPCTRPQKRPPNAAAVVRQWFLKPETLNLNPS